MTGPCLLSFAWEENTTTLSTRDDRLAEALALMFGAFLVERRGGDSGASAREPELAATVGEREFFYPSLEHAVLGLEEVIAADLLEGCGHLLLHAGAVTRGDLTILLLGHSGAGKTTLTLELVRRGFRFLGDEYVAIGGQAEVLIPFPRCTVVKKLVAELPAGERFELEVESRRYSLLLPRDRGALCPLPLRAPGHTLALVFPAYREGVATSVQPMGAGEVCAEILPSTFNFEHNEEQLWPSVGELALRSRNCSLEYSSVESGVDELLAFLGGA